MAKIGDNGVNGGQLRAFIERIERIAEIKAAATEDMKEVYEEAKSTGFDPKIMVRLCRCDGLTRTSVAPSRR